jgi:hypothetical protein
LIEGVRYASILKKATTIAGAAKDKNNPIHKVYEADAGKETKR